MKRVHFDDNIKCLNMCVWSYAYREARKNVWMHIVADRFRFELRIKRLEEQLNKIGFVTSRFDLRKKNLETLLDKIGFFSRT